MGTFITVPLNKNCPNCNFKPIQWQSKDITDKLGYSLDHCQVVKVKDIKEGYVYTVCPKCLFRFDIVIKNGKIVSEKKENLYKGA